MRSTTLSNGITILTETIGVHRSASIGVWLGLGSRHDPEGKAGLAHLYEHMVFKGTRARSAPRISRELEEVGGHLNAFTSREHTCFYAKILDRDVVRAIDVLTDLVTGAVLSGSDLRKERQVVLEEIRSCDDDPEERVGDLFAEALWTRHPLGAPIAGTVESVRALTVADLRRHQERSLSGEFPLVVSAAGAVDHDRIVEAASRRLECRRGGEGDRPRHVRPGRRQETRLVIEKDVSQVNLILSRRSLSASHPLRHALGLVNLVLGGGMASRLNQEIREKRGMAYSVYSFADHLQGTGAFGIGLGTEPGQAGKAVDLVARELRRLRQRGLSRRDLRFAKDYAAGSVVLGLESSSARMQNLGKCQLLYARPLSVQEIVETIERVTPDEIQEAIDLEIPELESGNGWTLSAVVPEGFKEPLLP